MKIEVSASTNEPKRNLVVMSLSPGYTAADWRLAPTLLMMQVHHWPLLDRALRSTQEGYVSASRNAFTSSALLWTLNFA